MSNQVPITFDYAGDMEIQYLSQTPEIGDHVIHRGALWVVRTVRVDDFGVVVVCELQVAQRT
jgi:hypothetical protein